MPNYLSGDDPPKKKPKQSVIAAAMASTVQRPDPTAIPRGPRPRTIPYFSVKKNERGQDSIPLAEQLQVTSIPDPLEPIVPLPASLFGPVRLNTSKVPDELAWQAPFLDTLTQIVGHQPGSMAAKAEPSPGTWGEFSGLGRRIAIGGQILPPDYFKKKLGVMLRAFPGEVRNTAAHEWGHLLVNQEDPILQAFIKAAPLPKKLRNDPTLPNVDFNQWPSELVANEAFADMFAAALSKRLPQMQPERGRPITEYPFTPQFGGRSRQVLMDSLVNSLTERLKQ